MRDSVYDYEVKVEIQKILIILSKYSLFKEKMENMNEKEINIMGYDKKWVEQVMEKEGKLL